MLRPWQGVCPNVIFNNMYIRTKIVKKTKPRNKQWFVVARYRADFLPAIIVMQHEHFF